MTDFLQNLFFFLRALPALLKYGLAGRWLEKGLDEPPGNVQVPKDFFGICAASSADPACDDYVIARLKELGARRVRLDFTYGSRNSFQERFLRRLINEKFQVCLHLVQPFAEARKILHSEEARQTWRLFVAEIFSVYGCSVEFFEIGSTCNRRKWSGYNLGGYLIAWRIARKVAATTNCTLAGPNVTDFDPVYNLAVLSAMKRLGLLPVFHSDNLFVERVLEPEYYDHKIAGKWLAKILKFNLIRKARLLNDIANRFGVARTICSHVSWSLRRIARFSDDVEEKQADYLARYCCLAAACGALERLYWGPLIGQREGLIDDGTTEFPEVPHVTFYGRARGEIKNYRIRPAFSALQTMNRFISGAEYVRKVPSERGLEIHEFKRPDGLLHVAWTMNGQRALMEECYQPAILEEAKIYSRGGGLLEQPPVMISESPVYIFWEGRQKLPVVASRPPAPLKNIRFASRSGQYNFIRRERYEGICLGDLEGLILSKIALKEGHLENGQDIKLLRDSRNRVWRIPLPKDECSAALCAAEAPHSPPATLCVALRAGGALQYRSQDNAIVIKMFKPPALFRRIFSRHKGNKALRSWNGANELLRRGILTPQPIAFFHHVDKPMSSAGWYVCEAFEGSFSVRDAFNALGAGADKFEGIPAKELYSRIALFIRKMHERGIYFRDLSAGNLLFRVQPDKNIEFALIDTARAKFYEKSLGLRYRLCDLMRICHPLGWKGRRIFLPKYIGLIGRRYRIWMNIPFYYYDLKHGLKKYLRRWW